MFRIPICLAGVVLGSALPPQASAQSFPLNQQFLSSIVVLHDGDTLRGPLTLRQDMDLLLVTMPDQTVRTVPALAVRTFAVRGEIIQPQLIPGGWSRRRRWFDVQRARPFLVYPWDHDREQTGTAPPAFFERLNGGPVILMRRQRLVRRAVLGPEAQLSASVAALPFRRGASTSTFLDVQEQFYLGTPEGGVVTLRRPRRDLLTYFAPEAAQLEEYAREKNYSFTDAYHLARLVDYANELRRRPTR